MKRLIFFLLFHAVITHASHIMTFGAGSGYDTNIILKQMKQQRSQKVQEGGFYYNSEINYHYSNGDFDLELLNIVEWIPEFNTYSKIEHSVVASRYSEWVNSSYTLGSSFTYSTSDFDDPVPYNVTGSFFLEFFYDHTEQHTTLILLQFEYQYGIAKWIDYLRGVSPSMEIGHYYYIDGEKNYLLFSWQGAISIYDQLDFNLEEGDEAISVTNYNRYLQSSVKLKGKFYYKKLQVAATTRWSYRLWLDREEWESFTQIVKKRRADNLFDLQLSLSVTFTQNISASLDYGSQFNLSSFGEESVDYVDWNYNRHYISLGVTIDL